MNDQGFNRVIWAERRAHRALSSAKERQLRPLELSSAHYSLLAAISGNPGAMGAELARELSVTPQNIAGLTARLERRGLIERQPNARHRNVVEMWVTVKGEELLAEADAAMIELERTIARILGADGSERLRRLLEDLADGLEGENRQGGRVRGRTRPPAPN
ncbi:MarR family winged helix-turn-helix transcriptional regulator [Streptomyces sp. NBC_01390]|uniref:MarR family winged helix-turn-helix transcriptional regulator n=1 Tax=Streptomyces sp. NBC_01390 TaxID=2903850 RepID=UPI00324D932A